MNCSAGLTEEQQRFADHPDGVFVQACPGAGKTRTVVARLARIAGTLLPRRGVAVLSFTNSAVEEFVVRCRAADLHSFLRHPSYIGTFDGFVRHFIVLPGGMAGSTVRPVIVDSWDSLDVEIRLAGKNAFPGTGVSLNNFDPDTNVIEPERIGHRGLRNHVRQHRPQYEQAARARRRGLLQAGYLSADDARIAARNHIRHESRGHALGQALAARFEEIIVDEGQDCNPLDLEILAWLRRHGVRVTVVCDANQAIYGFRNGNPGGLRAMAGAYIANCRLALSGNFRSSSAICALAGTLRNDANADRAVGCSAGFAYPVVVLAYGRSVSPAIGRAFLTHVAAARLRASEAIVLAHARTVAQRAAGDPGSRTAAGASRVEALARATGEFWSLAATARSREAALRSVEGLILDLMGLRIAGEHPARTLLRTGLNARVLRRKALAVLVSVPKVCVDADEDRAAWISCVHAEVAQLALPLPQGQTIRGFFRRPPNGQWSTHLQASVDLGLKCSTIHDAKGREYNSVCVVIPPNRAPDNHTTALFDAWENRIDEEAKRVIYVGVTRARKLSVLAVPEIVAERCVAMLADGDVPHRREDVDGDI